MGPTAFQFTPDGHHIIYTAAELDVHDLYLVSLDAPGVATKLNPPGGSIGDSFEGFFEITPDGQRVVYASVLDNPGVRELHVVKLSEPGVATTLNAALQSGGDIFGFAVAPDSRHALNSIVSAVLPTSRSVAVNSPATGFAAIINSGTTPAIACGLSPATDIDADFTFQVTDPLTNTPTGTPNARINIAPSGGSQSFVFSFTPRSAFPPTDVPIVFDCSDTYPAPSNVGLNTLLLVASNTAVPDIVALAATQPTMVGSI